MTGGGPEHLNSVGLWALGWVGGWVGHPVELRTNAVHNAHSLSLPIKHIVGELDLCVKEDAVAARTFCMATMGRPRVMNGSM